MVVWSGAGPVYWQRVVLAVVRAVFDGVLTHGLKPSMNWS
jgi:hypothetical protein